MFPHFVIDQRQKFNDLNKLDPELCRDRKLFEFDKSAVAQGQGHISGEISNFFFDS
jgi:hypothetical protein